MMFGLSDKVISDIQSVLRKHSEVEKVLIFGSRAKGNYRPGSDIDLAVIGKGVDYNLLLKIGCEIDDLELLYGIDLVDYQSKQSTPIGEHILRVGKVFYQKSSPHYL